MATSHKDFADFTEDWLLRHGTQRGLEIISEAARRIPQTLLADQPHIPWAEIMAIGNVPRHEYHRVSDRIVWNVVIHHLPPLHTAVLQLQEALRGHEDY